MKRTLVLDTTTDKLIVGILRWDNRQTWRNDYENITQSSLNRISDIFNYIAENLILYRPNIEISSWGIFIRIFELPSKTIYINR